MASIGGRRAVGKAAAIGASPSLAAAGVRPALAQPDDHDRDGRALSRAPALVERKMGTTDEQDTVAPSVLVKNRRIVTWREP
jgi:hypothetical protein